MLIQMAELFPTYEFLCVGKEDFFYRAFKRTVESAGCTNIRFTGQLDDQSLGVLYRQASVYSY